MQKELFTNLPENYDNLKKGIQNPILKSVYSQLTFLYLSNTQTTQIRENTLINQNSDYNEKYLFRYLQGSKLLTYQITNIDEELKQTITDFDAFKNKNEQCSQTVNLIICVEKKCLIVEKIDLSLLLKIMEKLKEQQVSIINCSKVKYTHQEDHYQVNEEIDNFCNFFFKRNKPK